jgi:hypothetical protein
MNPEFAGKIERLRKNSGRLRNAQRRRSASSRDRRGSSIGKSGAVRGNRERSLGARFFFGGDELLPILPCIR